MCGIAAQFAFESHATAPPLAGLEAMSAALAVRGPDGSGTWCSADYRSGLAHRRLAILDLSAQGAQPMFSADGQLGISFNGEIYNYPELRHALEAEGVCFRSHTDTEVLLHLYHRDGVAMLAQLRGMFAFALWDGRRRGLLLARDAYGIKPLYYSVQAGCIYAASQVQALLASGQVSRTPDPVGRAGFLLWGSVPEPWTQYAAIKSLGAGKSLWVDARGVREQEHFRLVTLYHEAEAAPAVATVEAVALARTALQESVQAHLLADVPVGAFLSAGVDSSSLVGLMREATVQPITTVTLRFAEFSGLPQDEAPLAEQVARHYQTQHHTVTVSATEFTAFLPQFLAAMDQPSIDGLNTWLVSRAAHQVGLKVVLSGLGGDELLGGYPSFRDIPRLVRWGGWPGGRSLRRVLHGLGLSPKRASLLEYGADYPSAYLLRRGIFLPWELPGLLGRELAEVVIPPLLRSLSASTLPATPFAKVACLESGYYLRNQLLRDSDWASMAHGLELRVPLVDVELTRHITPALLRAPLGAGKRWLAQAPVPQLPTNITRRRKTGFTTPIATWLQHAPALDAWRRVPGLRAPHCHWSRRLAYALWAYQHD